MKKQTLAFVLGLLLCLPSLCFSREEVLFATSAAEALPGFSYEHQEVTGPSIDFSSQSFSKDSIRNEVRELRQERSENMPYLGRGIIRDTIYGKRIYSRLDFAAGQEKKLQDLIDRAMAVQMASKAARERVSLAKRRIFVAVRELFPEIGFEYEDREGVIQQGDFNSRGYHFTVRQPIFRGGILWNTMLEEIAELRAAEKEHDQIVEDLVNDISEAYFEYNRSNQVVFDQHEAIAKMERYADISEQKFQGELISEIEHLNVQSLFSQMNYDFETAKQELELAQLDMQSFLDLRIEDDISVSPLYDMQVLLGKSRKSDDVSVTFEDEGYVQSEPKKDLPSLNDLVDLAYQNRAELQVESAKLESARMRERIQWGELLPRADIVLEMGALGESLDVLDVHPKRTNEFRLLLEFNWNMWGSTVGYDFETDQDAPSVTAFAGGGGGNKTTTNTFSVNLFDGLEALADIKEAEADKLDQIVELEDAEKEVIQDVKQAYFDYQKALIQFKSSLQRLDYRERLARLSKHRLEQNEIQISEYMQAEIDYLQEQTELHRALKDYFTAKAALNRAVGIRNYLPIEETYGQ